MKIQKIQIHLKINFRTIPPNKKVEIDPNLNMELKLLIQVGLIEPITIAQKKLI